MNLSLFLLPPATTIPWQRHRFTSLPSTCIIRGMKKMSVVPHTCSITAKMVLNDAKCISGFDRSKTAVRSFPVAVLLGLSIMLCQPVVTSEARAFDWFGIFPTISKDPVEPFTLYGSIFKKYFLENIVDGKVVSRKKGFTSTACVNALDANKETPELQGIPAGLKVVIIGEPLCSKSEGQSREETCVPACRRACIGAINRHLDEVTKETGYVLDSKDTNKVVDSCSSQCTNECLKPGKTTSFIYPFRPKRLKSFHRMLAAVGRNRQCSLPRFLLWRGIGTYHQHSRGGAGSRRPNKPEAPAPAAPPGPPEKEEWWVVDGELFKAEKFDPKAVLAPLENEHIPNKRRRKERIKHLALTRLKLRTNGQEAYWSAYMRRYQIMRNDWEKLVWDPKPAPPPKTRKASLIAKDAEKYVWKDPQRETYINNFQNTWMDGSKPNAKFNKPLGADRYPFASQRDTGGGRSFRERILPQDSDTNKDYKQGSKQDVRQSIMERSREKERDQRWCEYPTSSEDDEAELKGIECSSEGEDIELENVDFSWDESESGDETGTDDQSEYEDEDNIKLGSLKLDSSNEREFKPKRKGWYGQEDDLFKDDDEED